MAYSFAFSSDDESKSSSLPPLTKLPNARMEEQLQNTKLLHQNYQKSTNYRIDHEPLPKTIESALRSSHRAIVITETKKPFRVVNVNEAWETLCEYSYVESKGKSLGSLLRGPETDQLAVTALMSQLLRGEEAGTILTKYVLIFEFNVWFFFLESIARRPKLLIWIIPPDDCADVTLYLFLPFRDTFFPDQHNVCTIAIF